MYHYKTHAETDIYVKHISVAAYRERQMGMKVEIKKEKLINMHIHKMRDNP